MYNIFDAGILFPFSSSLRSYANSYSKDSDFEHDDSGSEPIKEESLWQAVILQAIADASCAPLNQKTRKEKTQAIIWFSMTNKDFLFVCEMAGIDPGYIIHNVKKVIKSCSAIQRRQQYLKRLRATSSKKQSDNFNHTQKTKPKKVSQK